VTGGARGGDTAARGGGGAADTILTWDDVAAIGLQLPGVVLGTAYGTPALRIGGPKGKLIARLRDDGVSVGVPCAPEEKGPLLATHQGRLFTTPHYDRSAYVCLALGPALWPSLVVELLEDAWAMRAPVKAVKAWRAGGGGARSVGLGWDDGP
jgi:hypothetical protein